MIQLQSLQAWSFCVSDHTETHRNCTMEVNNDAVEISDLACVKDSIELYVEAGEEKGGRVGSNHRGIPVVPLIRRAIKALFLGGVR